MEQASRLAPYIKCNPDILTTRNGVDGILILTEWHEFSQLNLEHLASVVKQRVLIDTRNLFTPEKVRNNGWKYWSVGRK